MNNMEKFKVHDHVKLKSDIKGQKMVITTLIDKEGIEYAVCEHHLKKKKMTTVAKTIDLIKVPSPFGLITLINKF